MGQHGRGGASLGGGDEWDFVEASEALVEALHAYVIALHLERGQARSALYLSAKLCSVGEAVCSEVSDLLTWRDMLEDEDVPLPPQPARPLLRLVHDADRTDGN